MIVAAHQPCFVPWLGYFHKIAGCDRFVVLDNVQYEKQNYQNRNRFKLVNGIRWLTVPVGHQSSEEAIADKRISYEIDDWRRRLWLTIEQAYGKSPHFRRYAPALRGVCERRWERLVELDLHLLDLCLEWLDIHTPRVLGSSLQLTQKKSALIVELCQKTGATTYLAGAGGSRSYLDVGLLASHGIDVSWQDFTHPQYPQLHPALGFQSHLSVLDLLFNCGPESRDVLLHPSQKRPSWTTPTAPLAEPIP